MQSSKKWFRLSVVSFFISSFTILFMPYGSFETDSGTLLAYFLAIVFWLFFILGFIFLIPVSKRRKSDKRYRRRSSFALLRFFSNRPAGVFDILLILGAATLIISLFFIRTLPGWVTLAATFTTVLSLEMHGLFNGRNYEYLNNMFGK